MITIVNQYMVKDENNIPLVSTIILSENMELMHDSVLTTIEKNENLFLSLGNGILKEQDFKVALNISNNKSLLKKRKAYYLNEAQVNFLFSLSRNTENIIKFKFAITKTFDDMKNKISTQSAQLEILKETLNQLSIMDNRVTTLESTRRLENWQELSLHDLKNKKVYAIAQKHDLTNDKEMIRKLHSRVWKCLKKRFNIPRYNELPSLKFNDGIEFINNLTFGDLL